MNSKLTVSSPSRKSTRKGVSSSKIRKSSTETSDIQPSICDPQKTDVNLVNEPQVEQNSEDEFTSPKYRDEVSSAKSGQNYTQNKFSSVKSIFTTDDITPDDEIYTVQFPQNYRKKDLYNKRIDLTELQTVITSKSGVFKVQLLNPDRQFITLAVPKNDLCGSLVRLPLKGHIIIQKDADPPVVELMDEYDHDQDAVVFPDDIKIRHPLLGIDWKDHINLAKAAFSKKNKKRKKEKLMDDIVKSEKLTGESDLLEFSPKRKKKRKIEF